MTPASEAYIALTVYKAILHAIFTGPHDRPLNKSGILSRKKLRSETGPVQTVK